MASLWEVSQRPQEKTVLPACPFGARRKPRRESWGPWAQWELDWPAGRGCLPGSGSRSVKCGTEAQRKTNRDRDTHFHTCMLSGVSWR